MNNYQPDNRQTTMHDDASPDEGGCSLPGRAVQQTFLITPDGGLLVPWVAPPAGPLVRALWEALAVEEFPVSNTTENLYCG
jgi:hypothetical protein